jgi:hypothetical protein
VVITGCIGAVLKIIVIGCIRACVVITGCIGAVLKIIVIGCMEHSTTHTWDSKFKKGVTPPVPSRARAYIHTRMCASLDTPISIDNI